MWLSLAIAARPDLPNVLVEDGYAVHYDDPAGGDANGDGIPDMVDRVLDGLRGGEEAFREAGYREVEPDEGRGGTEEIDVYLVHLDSNGQASSVALGGPHYSCYIEVEEDLGGIGGLTVESVAAHELHHCVQYAYARNSGWLHEASATLEQYRTFSDDGLVLAVGLLWMERLAGADLPLNSRLGRFDYAGFVFLYFWEEYGGSQTELWEALRVTDSWEEALEAEADRIWGLSLDELLLEYATWNAFACERDDGQHYPDEGPLACTVEASVEVSTAPVEAELERWSAAYFELPAEEERPVQLRCDSVVGLKLVALDAEGVAGEERGGWTDLRRLQSPLDPKGSVLVVLSSGSEGASVSCTVTRVEPVVEGCGCGGGPAPGGLALLLCGLAACCLRSESTVG